MPTFNPSAGVTLRLGLVANRCAAPTAINAARSFFSRSDHFAGDDLQSLQVVLGQWYGAGGQESTTSLQDVTYTAAVEWPLNTLSNNGTLTQITFGGSASGLCTVGSTIVSDVCNLALKIPKGARFRLRFWGSVGAGKTGIVMCGGMTTARQISGGPINDIYRYSAGSDVTDQTMTLATSAMTYPLDVRGFKPLAVIGYTTCRSIGLMGDSRTQGWLGGYGTDRATDGFGLIGQGERIVGRTGLPFINLAFASDSAVNFTQVLAPRRIDLLKYVTDGFCAYGINDIGVGSASGMNNRMRAIKLLPNLAGKSFQGCTLPPITTGAWSLADGSDQTVTANEATRVAWNEAVRAGDTVFDRVTEVADTVESFRNSGKWKAGSRAVADGVSLVNTYVATSATAAFTSADIGKCLSFAGAGFGGGAWVGIVQAVTATTATLNTPCATTVAATGTLRVGDIYTIDGTHETMQANLAYQTNVPVPLIG